MKIKDTPADRIFNVINLTILLILVVLIIYPLYFVVIASISDPVLVNSGQTLLLPKGFNLEGYTRVIQKSDLWLGYRNSIGYTLGTVACSLLLTIPAAYALSRPDMVGRNVIMLLFSITMLFSGGLIPTYLVVKQLGLPNTPWALIIPSSLSVYNLIVARTFMARSIPLSLQEAARIDGASDFTVFLRVVLPLSAPIIAVMALFYGMGRWNDYFSALIYVSKRHLVPLQVVLRELLLFSSQAMGDFSGDPETMAQQARIAELMKYCIIIVASLPAMVAYPFVQKYFTQGIMLGAIKG